MIRRSILICACRRLVVDLAPVGALRRSRHTHPALTRDSGLLFGREMANRSVGFLLAASAHRQSPFRMSCSREANWCTREARSRPIDAAIRSAAALVPYADVVCSVVTPNRTGTAIRSSSPCLSPRCEKLRFGNPGTGTRSAAASSRLPGCSRCGPQSPESWQVIMRRI